MPRSLPGSSSSSVQESYESFSSSDEDGMCESRPDSAAAANGATGQGHADPRRAV